MAIAYYDNALLEKVKSWVNDPNMKITGPDETRRLFQYQADIKDDKPIQLPLIALRRGRDVDILSTNKKPLTFDGATLEANAKQSGMLNGIPIAIKYQLDIYSRYYQEADEYIRNFIFNFINFPKLKIEIPYNNAKIEHISNVRLEQTVVDNSDIAERLIPGQFTRFTLSLYIDDAYIFDYKFRNNYITEIKGEIGLKDTDFFEKL